MEAVIGKATASMLLWVLRDSEIPGNRYLRKKVDWSKIKPIVGGPKCPAISSAD
jgi:hypothetical protein